MILGKTVNELTANLLIKLVVAQVETEERGVVGQGLDYLLDTQVLLAVMRQVVRLEVQVPQCFILAQRNGENSRRLHAETVTLQLHLAKRLVVQQQASDVLALLILDALPTEV